MTELRELMIRDREMRMLVGLIQARDAALREIADKSQEPAIVAIARKALNS